MKKVVILILTLISVNLLADEIKYNVNLKKNNSKNYVEKYKEELEKEEKLEALFNNIKKGNNKYITSRLWTKEKMKLQNENEEESKNNYGPKNSEIFNVGINENNFIDVNAKNKKGFTPLIVAIESQNNEIVKFLLDNGVSVYSEYPGLGKLSLHTAAYYENIEAIKMILDKYPKLVNIQSQNDGFTALQEAVLKNNVEIVKLLLDRGADPRIKDYKGGTAMDMATEFGKGEIVKELRLKMKQQRN